MEPLLDAAEAGYITLYWSPAIIAEVSRVLVLIWLWKRGGQLTGALRREASEVAHRWFDYVTTVLRVVEDCPPYEDQWTDSPRDTHDRPIWTAAVRAGAHFVVTENLKDGPPEDSEGYRVWNDIVYVHPDQFLEFLDGGTDIVDASAADEILVSQAGLSASTLRFLRLIEVWASAELPSAEQPE